MAIFCAPSTVRRTNVNEAGLDICPVSGPDIVNGWAGDYLYYWACQISWHDASGVEMGGGHCGLQAFHSVDLPAGAKPTIVNFGVYDSVIGGLATFRSSKVLTLNTFIDINSSVSFGFSWNYGEWLRFRVFKSPKQDWLASSIRPGDLQVAPYVGTDQQATEVAYRCTIENLTRGTPPVEFRDVLIKNPAADLPMMDGQFWTEIAAGSGYPGGQAQAELDWPDSPECRFRHSDWDGAGMVSQYALTYKVGTANSNQVTVGGTPGYVKQFGPTTRTNPDGTLVAPPSGFWDAAQANVTAAPDLTAPTTTPRPWY